MEYTKEHIQLLDIIIRDFSEQVGFRFQHFVQAHGGFLDEKEIINREKTKKAYFQGQITGLAIGVEIIKVIRENVEEQFKANPSTRKHTKKVSATKGGD